ncbi:MAG: type II toxin-antitoxin system VapC family toxin [Xanthobacteraceae bacterium]|nr:type II toxin-antitoxin system VapC family toxin [Xanthobacteraceae bacterium]MBV9235518.1 type II toxin-antitoxin system VapC family toxin [Xanthobacteraceae bacterium]MBV9630386.1 type II toxin-antitoxin system VapC family toxin [Xanthobacteraceae bacterium]
MIVVDASALFAIVMREPELDAFVDIFDAEERALCSTVTYVETVMTLTGRSRRLARARVDELLQTLSVELVAVDPALAQIAVDAFERFGKGRHRARLNLGDCFSYALAKARNLPLLFKGDDFARTDIVPAWRP